MIKKLLLLSTIYFFLSIPFCESTVNPANCLPESAEVLDWEIVETRHIRSDTELFDYMNGGAELYRSFNFRKLSVREFKSPDESILKVEVYMFKDSYDAYGIYTMLPMGEPLEIGNDGGYDLGVARFWKGRFLCKVYCVWNDWNSFRDVIISTAKVVESKISDTGESPAIIKIFPQENLETNGLHYFYDYIALKNLYYITYSNVLSLNMNTKVVLGEYSNLQAEDLKLLLIKYPTDAVCDSAFTYFTSNYLHIDSESMRGYHVFKELDPALFVELDRIDNYLIVGFEQSHNDLLKSRVRQLKNNLQNYLNKL